MGQNRPANYHQHLNAGGGMQRVLNFRRLDSSCDCNHTESSQIWTPWIGQPTHRPSEPATGHQVNPVHIPSSAPFYSLSLRMPNLPNYILPYRISHYHSGGYEDVTPCSLLAVVAIYFHAGILLGLLWRWKRYVPSKRRQTFNGPQGVISQKTVVFNLLPCFLTKIV
jgi:hypothetical protein